MSDITAYSYISSSSIDGDISSSSSSSSYNRRTESRSIISEVELVLPPGDDVSNEDVYLPSERIKSSKIVNAKSENITESENNEFNASENNYKGIKPKIVIELNDENNKNYGNKEDIANKEIDKLNDTKNGDVSDTDKTVNYKHYNTPCNAASVSFFTKIVESSAHMAAEQKNEPRTEKRTSHWEELMRKFSEAHKEECKAVSLDIPRAPRSAKQFPTGSKYEGSWDLLGMSGYGTYTFPNGVIYVGDFEDGMFQGAGELRYPEGAVLKGTWKKGHMSEKTLFFADGLEYCEHDWKYCKMPDRRFAIEYEKGLRAGGESYLTADQPTKKIPDGFYDTGDGFFEPKTSNIYRANDVSSIVRSAAPLESKWIQANCRTSPDVPVGPRPELYEQWSQPQPEPTPEPPPAAPSRIRHASDSSEEFTFIHVQLESTSDSHSTTSSDSDSSYTQT